MPRPVSSTHLVLIPSFNPGQRGEGTVRAARAQWAPVWVVDDGSTDGSGERLALLARDDPHLRVLSLPRNRGKGAAVLVGAHEALRAGFSHALVMDADGQHPADQIERFMRVSLEQPRAMVLGVPVFAANAPLLRVHGRRVSNWWANLETLWAGIGDSLYGFRVYPLAPLCAVMERRRWMRRFDFDPEVAVRMCWSGVKPVNVDAPVRYLSKEQGGVSHFRYLRDNALLSWMHARLLCGFVLRLPLLLVRRARG